MELTIIQQILEHLNGDKLINVCCFRFVALFDRRDRSCLNCACRGVKDGIEFFPPIVGCHNTDGIFIQV